MHSRLLRHGLAGALALLLAGSVLATSAVGAATVGTGEFGSASSGQIAPLPPPPTPGRFIPSPVYGNLGIALVVYMGGSIADLELAAGSAGAAGVWVQDVTGRFQLLPVQAPAFVTSSFAGAFPSASPSAPNFPQAIAVTLIVAPTLATPPPEAVTLAQNGTVLAMRVGGRFLLTLGESATWNVQVADQNVVSRVANVTVIRGAQGVYQANLPGTTTLTADGAPICAPGAACIQAMVRFNLAIVVLPAGTATSGIQGTVTRWPITPVCQVAVPCASPYQAMLTIQNASGVVIARIQSGIDGHYAVTLPAGRYTVVPLSPVGQSLPRAAPVQIDVLTGQFTIADIQYDTGIR